MRPGPGRDSEAWIRSASHPGGGQPHHDAGAAHALIDAAGYLFHAATGIAYTGSDAPGIMFTAWFARSDNAPAILADGKLELPGLDPIYGARATPEAPWPAGARNASNQFAADVRPTIAKFQWEGDVIGLLTDVIDGVGTFRARGRVGEWVDLAIADAVDFQLEGNLIALLRVDGSLRVKNGVSGPWTDLVAAGSDLRAFRLEVDRIGVLHESGLLRVKQGVDGPWTELAAEGSGVRSFDIVGPFIGVLYDSGRFRIKEGIHGEWTELAGDGSGVIDHATAAQYELDDDDNLILVPYIGLLHEAGMLRVKRTFDGAWSLLADAGIAAFQLQGNPYRDASVDMIRIGALHEDGTFRVKERIDGAWTTLAAAGTGTRSFQLQDNLIGVLLDDGMLRVKQGIDGPWVSTPAYGAGVTQYRLLVDVPAKPERTTLANYTSQQARCTEQHANVDYTCHPAYQDGILDLVPLYGRFCGAGRPAEFGNYDWGWAIGEGPVDALDWTCRHHDQAPIWYPEAYGAPVFNATGSCVVRYALRHSRLTRDGVLLAYGEDDEPFNPFEHAWDDAWNSVDAPGMANLKDALSVYSAYVQDCTEGMLANFSEETSSRNQDAGGALPRRAARSSARTGAQGLLHRLALREFVDELVHVADAAHQRIRDLFHPHAANRALDQRGIGVQARRLFEERREIVVEGDLLAQTFPAVPGEPAQHLVDLFARAALRLGLLDVHRVQARKPDREDLFQSHADSTPVAAHLVA